MNDNSISMFATSQRTEGEDNDVSRVFAVCDEMVSLARRIWLWSGKVDFKHPHHFRVCLHLQKGSHVNPEHTPNAKKRRSQKRELKTHREAACRDSGLPFGLVGVRISHLNRCGFSEFDRRWRSSGALPAAY